MRIYFQAGPSNVIPLPPAHNNQQSSLWGIPMIRQNIEDTVIKEIPYSTHLAPWEAYFIFSLKRGGGGGLIPFFHSKGEGGIFERGAK